MAVAAVEQARRSGGYLAPAVRKRGKAPEKDGSSDSEGAPDPVSDSSDDEGPEAKPAPKKLRLNGAQPRRM